MIEKVERLISLSTVTQTKNNRTTRSAAFLKLLSAIWNHISPFPWNCSC